MKYSKKYYFSDFTLKNYRNLFVLALKSYKFDFFTNEIREKSILLRHDVEFSIPIARRLAEIEADLGIKSTFFFQLHSEFYNTFEKDTINAIEKIKKLGHQIGLHFDTHFWNITNENKLAESILVDKEMLEKYNGVEIKVFSFHNNTPFTLSCRNETYGGMLNVYSNHFRRNYAYVSDSLGYWRFERLEDLLSEAKANRMQILIHDGMWQNSVLSPRQRIHKVIDDRANYLKVLYDKFLKKVGAKNIDWDEIL